MCSVAWGPPDVQAIEPGVPRDAHGLLKFVWMDPPVDRLVALVGPDPPGRVVLIHDVHVRVDRHLRGDPLEDLPAARDPARHHQVPQEHAALGQSVLVQLQRPDLAVHLPDDTTRCLGIVWRLHVKPAHLPVPELEVRHVDVHDVVEQTQGVHRVVGAGVVDDRETQSQFNCNGQRLQDLRHDVLRGNEVDVVAPLVLEEEHHARKVGRGNYYALSQLADVEVQAIHTAEVAPSKEDRAAPTPAAEAVLFTEVGEETADPRVTAGLADSVTVLQAVDPAVSGADLARPEEFEGFRSPPTEFGQTQMEVGGPELRGGQEELGRD